MNMKPTRLDAYYLLHEGIQAFARAEAQGMRIDLEYCLHKKNHLTRKIEWLRKKLMQTKFYKHWAHVMKNPNIDSNFQLAKFLYDIKKIKPPKLTSSGRGATDEEALSELDIPEVKLILEMRKLKKIRDTYLDAFIREQTDGFVHPFFNLHTVRTYRSSSDHPNFQNIPKRDKEAMRICRKAILPRKGHQLLEVDYSGVEVRVSQCYHKDRNMQKYIEDPSTDMHGDMAAQIFLINDFNRSIPEHKYLRNAAKNGFVFPQFYGDYYKNCAENLACKWGHLPKGKWKTGQGVPMPNNSYLSDHLISHGIKSYMEFEEHIKRVEADFWGWRFKEYNLWKEKSWEAYQRKGYIDLLTGFRVSGVMRRNEALNFPIQGSAFHCLLWSFIELDKRMRKEKWDTRLVGQIHDAILFDVHPKELDYVVPIIEKVMTQEIRKAWDWIIVPLEVEMDICDVDAPWSEKRTFVLSDNKKELDEF